MRTYVLLAAALAVFTLGAGPAPGSPPLTLVVDAREVARNIVHVQLDVPIGGTALEATASPARYPDEAAQPGPRMRLVFPKWVPGEHAPANPVVDLVMLEGTVDGKRVEWQRDPVDLFAFTFALPPNAQTLTLHYDALLSSGYTTTRLALINWNPTLLYPAGVKTNQQQVDASMILPAGWDVRTALDDPKRTGGRIDFAPVTIERLFDSPVLASPNLKVFPLGPTAELDVASDSPAPPVVDPKVQAHFTALVDQAQLLFGSHHWRSPYHFLMTATDAIGYTGLEHHESSWNGVDTETLATEAACKRFAGDLLTHEFTHSWNGKYRRPAGLVRADYQADETTDGLWVYEGLTEYYSDVLAARAGFWTPDEYRAALAAKYAALDAESGRMTRTLADTTFQARFGNSRAGYPGARRSGEEYYDESELMWLDADTLIRERTHGAKSLDDFARAFYGVGGDTPPAVLPYTRADVVSAMNAVLPNDWERFFHNYLDVPTAHPPLAGITRGGYAFAFGAKPATLNPSTRIGGNTADYRYSVGARIAPKGEIGDIVAASPAAHAGLAPGMTIVAIDNRRFTPAALTAAVSKPAPSSLTLLVENRQTFETKTLVVGGGMKLPMLERATGTDYLRQIASPRAR